MRIFLYFLFLYGYLYGFEINGEIFDAKTKKKINKAVVCDKTRCQSIRNGKFSFKTDSLMIAIKAFGYKPYRFNVKEKQKQKHFLSPIKIKALYLTYWGASPNSKTFNNLLKIIDKTGINAVIVDIKNEHGYTSYKTDVKRVNSYGAWHKRTIKDIDRFIKILKERDIYLIGRIVTFKDDLQARNNLEYAIKDQNGSLWTNSDQMAWVDPFDKRSWKYNVDIAEDAAKRGFDEINFDYIRFPAKDTLKLKKENNAKNRTKAISGFLDYAKKRLNRYGVFVSVDTFGNILWAKDDSNIGQTLDVFKHADYLCPMLYPSGFNYGSFGFKYPSLYPYEVVYRSIKHIEKKFPPKRIRVWIQAFRDYTKPRIHYGYFEIKEQIKASEDMHTNGFMVWHPSSKYDVNNFIYYGNRIRIEHFIKDTTGVLEDILTRF